jgi:general L-amino acid transport system permease protein
MATITQTTPQAVTPTQGPGFDLDVMSWLRNNVFNNIWKTIFAIILVAATLLIIWTAYGTKPIDLATSYIDDNQPTALGQVILTLTAGPFLTTVILLLWLVGAMGVIYSAARRHWPGLTRWLKDNLYTGFFGALTTLILVIMIVFTIRGMLAWAVFGAEFSADPEQIVLLKETTPGAIWGVVLANLKLFAVGQYPQQAMWRIWTSLGLVLLLSTLSILAWSFGSSLRKLRPGLVWAWLASLVFIYLFLKGLPGAKTGPLQEVSTNLWGGFLLTVVMSVLGIVISFPIGVLLALGRRSQTRGVPFLWLWSALALILFWTFGNFPTEPVTLNIPVFFRDPPIWSVTLAPMIYAALQAIVIVGTLWAVGHFLQGNLIKTFSIAYIELVRGVPLITILFMANIMLPFFLPKGLEIDNLLRVTTGMILFSAAYIAENVRGGLQAIPKGQYEAAAAIGLNTAQAMRLIILPQALRAVIPANVGQFISLFKDTSLVSVVGLLELLMIAQVVVAQPEWLGLQRETYVFVALIYWVICFFMSVTSQRLERKLGVGKY